MKLKTLLLSFLIALLGCNTKNKNTVQVVGAMKNVMKKGELFGRIDLDTISNRKNFFGLGPCENLSGEITVFEGKSYVSKVISDSTMGVRESFAEKAPFFVYSNIETWTPVEVPENIRNLSTLEDFLNSLPNKDNKPFAFRVASILKSATIHVVNLPKGTKVNSPEDAHHGQVKFEISDEEVDLIGFYSTKHKSIFTHHDTNIHVHLITKDRKKMGHLERARFEKLQLFISHEID